MKISYLLQRVLNMNYRAMLDKIGSIHRKTGRSRLAIFWDMDEEEEWQCECAAQYGEG